MDMQEALSVELINEIDLVESFLCDCKVRNFSPGTIASYKSHIKYFLSFYSVNANMNDFKDFLVLLRDERALSASTVDNYFCALSTFYDFLLWEKIVTENIVPQFKKRFVRYYKEQKPEKRQLINKEQMKNLINSTEDLRFKAMFLFFAKTVIRRQELIDIDLEDIHISKNYAVLKPHAKRSSNYSIF
jgi:integrase/recombinase XerD